MSTKRKEETGRAAGSGPQPGIYWCVSPGRAPVVCAIYRYDGEDDNGQTVARLGIDFLRGGSFKFPEWQRLYCPNAQFIPVQPPNPQ